MTKDIKSIIKYLSPKIRQPLESVRDEIWLKAEEIHLSNGKPVIIYHNGGFETVKAHGEEVICDREIISETVLLLTDNSLYSVNDKICNGYVTVRGGNRVGIVGTAVLKDGRITTIKDISSVNIRLSREIFGIADKLKKHIISDYTLQNTLIISPPRCGKTTLLRDIARMLGDGNENTPPYKVSVIDERGEIAAIYNGVAENNVGLCTDVLDNCPKTLGIPYVIRSMAPDVIITDELGDKSDFEAVKFALSCGVKVIASIHGDSIADIKSKEGSSDITSVFDLFVLLTSEGGTGTIEKIVRRGEYAL